MDRDVSDTELILLYSVVNCFCLQPGQHPKELNPYWKEGGTGLPSERETSQESTHKEGIKADFIT